MPLCWAVPGCRTPVGSAVVLSMAKLIFFVRFLELFLVKRTLNEYGLLLCVVESLFSISYAFACQLCKQFTQLDFTFIFQIFFYSFDH